MVIWWFLRPADLTEEVGSREWAIVEVDDVAATNEVGTVSAFVLDGNGEARWTVACNTETGTWSYDKSDGLELIGGVITLVGCESWPATYQPISGTVDLDGPVMKVNDGISTVRSIDLVALPVASAEQLAGQWQSGESVVEFGQRGLLMVDDCEGSWTATGDGIVPTFGESESNECDLEAVWTNDAVLLPTRFEDSLYLRREGTAFPLDRQIYRLDTVGG